MLGGLNEFLDWVFNDAWTAIMIGLTAFLLFLAIIYLEVYIIRESQRINSLFAVILLNEDEVNLPKTIAHEIINGAFLSKDIKDGLVVDIYEDEEKKNWVYLVARKNVEQESDREGLIATATEENFRIIILKYLL